MSTIQKTVYEYDRDDKLFFMACKTLAMYESALIEIQERRKNLNLTNEDKNPREGLLNECVCLILLYNKHKTQDLSGTTLKHFVRAIDYYFKTLAYSFSPTGIKKFEVLTNQQRLELIETINHFMNDTLDTNNETHIPYWIGYKKNIMFETEKDFWMVAYCNSMGYTLKHNVLCDLVTQRNITYRSLIFDIHEEAQYNMQKTINFTAPMITHAFNDESVDCVYPYENNQRDYNSVQHFLSVCLLESDENHVLMNTGLRSPPSNSQNCTQAYTVYDLNDFYQHVHEEWYPIAEQSISFPSNTLQQNNKDTIKNCCMNQERLNLSSNEMPVCDNDALQEALTEYLDHTDA